MVNGILFVNLFPRTVFYKSCSIRTTIKFRASLSYYAKAKYSLYPIWVIPLIFKFRNSALTKQWFTTNTYFSIVWPRLSSVQHPALSWNSKAVGRSNMWPRSSQWSLNLLHYVTKFCWIFIRKFPFYSEY